MPTRAPQSKRPHDGDMHASQISQYQKQPGLNYRNEFQTLQ
jgi:hypothetical protein